MSFCGCDIPVFLYGWRFNIDIGFPGHPQSLVATERIRRYFRGIAEQIIAIKRSINLTP